MYPPGPRARRARRLGVACEGAHAGTSGQAGREPAWPPFVLAPATIDEERTVMSLFQRAHEIVQAKANKALDAAENPGEMLDLSYEQMLDQITQIRRALVNITASRRQIELQEQQFQHSVDHAPGPGQGSAVAGPARTWPGRRCPGKAAAQARSTAWSRSVSSSGPAGNEAREHGPSPPCRRR